MMRGFATGAAGGRLRALVLLVGVALLCLSGGLASAKSAPSTVGGYAPSGTLTITWVGDRALGCVAEGACGYSGSLAIRPDGGSFGGGPSPTPIVVEDDTAVARSVERSASGATVSACSTPEAAAIDLVVRRRAGRLVAVVPTSGLFFSGGGGFPSAGECAGPLASDLMQLALPARRSGAHNYYLRGSDSFPAGPFEVTARASIDAHYGTMSEEPRRTMRTLAPRRQTSHRVLSEHASVTYRVVSAVGSVSASFAGFNSPDCVPFGTCASTGTVSLIMHPLKDTISFIGRRTVKRAVGRGAALGDLAAGRLSTFDTGYGLPWDAVLHGSLTGPGGTCSDSVDGYGPALLGQVKHGQDDFRLDPVFSGDLVGGEELRSHCPGPDTYDIVGQPGALASGTIALADLGASRITLTLKASGTAGGNGYQSQRSGTLVVTLLRSRETGGTSRVPEPTGPVGK